MTPRVRLALSVTAVVAGGLLAAGVTHLTGAEKSGLPAVGQVIPPLGARPPRTCHRAGSHPSTYIIDARGRIAWAWFGATSYSQLDLAVTLAASSRGMLESGLVSAGSHGKMAGTDARSASGI